MKKMLRSVALLLALVTLLTICFTSCKKQNGDPADSTSGNDGNEPAPYVTNRTFTGVLPSNWNELTYEDNNDTQILSYIGSSFFEYDYKFDEALGGKFKEDGSVNADAIVPGSFTTNFLAATKLEDVTSTVDAKWGYTEDQKKEGGYAWKITLREDLKWDDGTAIDASDFVYSMQEQLNPLFMNYRASQYYGSIKVKNAKQYLYSKTDFTYEPIASQGFANNQAVLDAGKVIYVDMHGFYGAKGAPKVTSYDETTFVPQLDYVYTCPQWVAYNDEQLYFDYAYFKETFATDHADFFNSDEKATINFDKVAEFNATAGDEDKIDLSEFFFSSAMIYGAYASYFEVGADYAAYVAVPVENTDKVNSFEDVGLYSPSKYELVICLDAPHKLLKEDGTLSYLSAYYMASLPLVKKDLYESCKKEPAAGSTLWTTNYNSTLETTASWGPYKLATFQAGKSYELVRNDNWFGYGMDTNKNQYNITKIECELVEKLETQWMGFLSGKFDGIAIDSDHLEYVDSKYAVVNYGSTAYGIQVYSNLPVLKTSGRNNGILAIQDFRQALSLSLDRADFNKTVFGTLPPSYGIIGEGYFSDVENGISYRNTPQAKKALLRTYGFTENSDGTWYDGTHTYADVDKAYEAMNGYNPTKAKELLLKAYNELTSKADYYGYDATKDIEILYGATNASETSTKKLNFMQKLVDGLTADTPLAGKIKIKMDTKYGSTWSDSFKAGSYDLCIVAGIGGNIFNPFDTIGAFVDPDDNLKFSSWWDSSLENITFKMPAGDYEGAGQEHTMSVVNWYFCLNGRAANEEQDVKYNWGEGYAPQEARLEILAMLEEYVLNKFFSVQCSFDAEMALDGAKFSSISDEYNTFMSYGGIRYSIVNYTDAEWDAYVKANNGDLTSEYKKAE